MVAALAAAPGINREMAGGQSSSDRWCAEAAARRCVECGLDVEQALEHRFVNRFLDAGAVAWYLKAVPWTIENFSIYSHAHRLLELHRRIEREGFFDTTFHEFLIVARRPVS